MTARTNSLLAAGPHPSLGTHADTFARVIGSWVGEFRDIDQGVERRGEMEAHFYWALDGRAVQDVWIVPSLAVLGGSSMSPLYFGSTIRVFEQESQSWRMFWFNPVQTYVRCDLVGRRVGDDIVQLGTFGDTLIKWVFEEITPRSFAWRGYSMGADGIKWNLGTEFLVHRA